MNAVAVATRRGRISPDRASAFLGVLAGFSFAIAAAPEVDDLPRLQALAARHHLTAYDAAYLDLAQRLGIPLATLDGDLMSAAIAEGVEIL
jgi:predicted nucleic acid-binding protein